MLGKDDVRGFAGNEAGDGGPGNDTCSLIETPVSCEA
jgi:hypothetical protein